MVSQAPTLVKRLECFIKIFIAEVSALNLNIMNQREITYKITQNHLLKAVVLFDICGEEIELTPTQAVEILNSERYDNAFRYNMESPEIMVIYNI